MSSFKIYFKFGVLISLFVLAIHPQNALASILESDLNDNGIPDSTEQSVTVAKNASLPYGDYIFNNLIIENNATLTLEGDPESSDSFKGVKITATNLTINEGAHLSADETGYINGPGTPSDAYLNAASYGGKASGVDTAPIYGSAKTPTDLGSGTEGRAGGGAIRLIISDTLRNDGNISADGVRFRTSGGSMYITTNHLLGKGTFTTSGGGANWPQLQAAGGGGRIAIYYNDSSFEGKATALGGFSCFYGCQPSGEDGTVGFFDLTQNNLNIISSWRFQKNDEPFDFNTIALTNSATAQAEKDTTINAENLLVSGGSSFILPSNQVLNVPVITIDEKSKLTFLGNASLSTDSLLLNGASALTLSGEDKIAAKTLTLSGESTVTVTSKKILTLTIANISIDPDSSISSFRKGYCQAEGPGAPTQIYDPIDPRPFLAGASYGGVGMNNTPESVYGDENLPIDFGSANNASTNNGCGGGAIRIITDNLSNNGSISSDGGIGGSGGSVYVTAKNLNGDGKFTAKGGYYYCPGVTCYMPGAGGRIAVYYENSTFTGITDVSPGLFCSYGCTLRGEAGTTVMKAQSICAENCFSNVMFLPGVMSSRLYEEDARSTCDDPANLDSCIYDKELWVSKTDSNHARLNLDSNGKSVNNIYTKNDTKSEHDEDETGIVDEIVFGGNIYNSFINNLREWKNEGTIADYDFIPYDWRLSMKDVLANGKALENGDLTYTQSQDFSNSFILKKLEDLQKSSKSGKVTIITHSNGGLVAKALMQKLKDTNNPLYNKIDKIIMVAVPQIGTPDALAMLLHGSDIGPAGFVMNNERSRQLSENMPSVYNLLPSSAYFTTVDPGFVVDKLASFPDDPLFASQISQYGFYISNETELKNYILGTDGRTKPSYGDTLHPNIGNNTLYTEAENLHSILDNWQPPASTKVIQIAGWGEETLAGLDYEAYLSYPPSKGKYISYKPRSVIDGDGTVIVPSALWMPENENVERWWVDLKEYSNQNFLNRKHRNILEISDLRDFIKSKIINPDFNNPNNIILNDDASLVSDRTRLHYTLHSPLTLGITDSQGRYTGMDSITKEIKEEIPDVTYKQIGDVQFISIPAGKTYTLKLQGYENGVFSLDVDSQTGNIITASTSFQGIPSTASTSVTMDIVPTSNVSNTNLKVDQNNDGILEYNLIPKIGEVVILPKYNFSGFLSPINNNKKDSNIFKAGSTIPLKFQLKKPDGSFTQTNSTPVWLAPQKGSLVSTPIDQSKFNTSIINESVYKWDATSQQYLYNWSTKGLAPGYWYKVYTKLDDGNIYSVIIGLK